MSPAAWHVENAARMRKWEAQGKKKLQMMPDARSQVDVKDLDGCWNLEVRLRNDENRRKLEGRVTK